MDNNPIHLTILRRGDVHIVDLAEVQAIIPRSETRVEGSFLEEISEELKRITNIVGPQFRASVAAAGSDTRPNPGVVDDLKDLGSLIFSHLLPIEARSKLRDAGACNLYLRLDDQLVHLPWELAYDGQQFLGMKFSVGRQIITHHRAAQASPIRAGSEILRVLIISDPSETLANVSRESEQLCEILDEVPGLQVRLLGGRNVKRIPLLAALRQSDIVHFAGHSQFDEKNPENSGWLLHDGLLSASEISKLDQAPLLVFSNSCQAGATKNWQGNYLYEGEAFGLGSAFLLAGVRNFVGTFCVVHDEESRFLAVEFYKRVAEGRSIGQALLDARRATASAMGFDRLTWASYMLYGDPAFSLSHAAKQEVQLATPPAEARVSTVQVQPPTFSSAAESKRGRFKWPRLSFKVSISFTVGMLAVLVFGHFLRTEFSKNLPEKPALEQAPLRRGGSENQDTAYYNPIPSDAKPAGVAPYVAGEHSDLPVATPNKESGTASAARPGAVAGSISIAEPTNRITKAEIKESVKPPIEVAINKEPPVPPIAAPLTLSMNIIGQRKEADGSYAEVLVNEGSVLRSRDNFQVHLEANRPAYVYILLYDSQGRASRLFPDPKIDHPGFVEAGRKAVVPAKDLWFWLDQDTGTETIYVLTSEKPMSDIQGLLAKMEGIDDAGKQRVSQEIKQRIAIVQRGVGGITKGQAVTYTLSDGKKIQKVTEVVTGTGSVVRAVSFQHR